MKRSYKAKGEKKGKVLTINTAFDKHSCSYVEICMCDRKMGGYVTKRAELALNKKRLSYV